MPNFALNMFWAWWWPLVLLGLTEAGPIVPVSFATMGLAETSPIWVADPAVIAFLQGVTLIAGVILSLVLTQKIAHQPFLKLLPQHGLTLGMAVLLWQLIV